MFAFFLLERRGCLSLRGRGSRGGGSTPQREASQSSQKNLTWGREGGLEKEKKMTDGGGGIRATFSYYLQRGGNQKLGG